MNYDPDEKKPELDWTDDEFYEGAWSWVDECELDDEEDKDQILCTERITQNLEQVGTVKRLSAKGTRIIWRGAAATVT